MAVHTIQLDADLPDLFDEAVYTRARLAAFFYTQALAADYDAFIAQWRVVRDQDTSLQSEIVSAKAAVSSADDDLDDLLDETAKTLLIFTKNERKDPEFTVYFGNKRPSELKRPLLGPQLEAMRAWIDTMKASPHAAIVDLGKRVEVAVARGDAVTSALAAAEQKKRVFQKTGAWKQLVDAFNALRKSTYGKLSEMPHTQPALKLPRGFADRFFRVARPGNGAKTETIADIEARLDDAKATVAKVEAELKTAQDAAAKEAADAANAARAENEKKLADAQQRANATAEEIAALKAKLDPQKPEPPKPEQP